MHVSFAPHRNDPRRRDDAIVRRIDAEFPALAAIAEAPIRPLGIAAA